VGRLEEIFELMEMAPKGKKCPAILGILEEGTEIMKGYKGMRALDAGLVGAAQAVEHYEISRYGSLRAWAQDLGLTKAVRLLDSTLREETKTDEALTKLAMKVVNQEAT
jgi:ferritin-like metal-binding protein YciE